MSDDIALPVPPRPDQVMREALTWIMENAPHVAGLTPHDGCTPCFARSQLEKAGALPATWGDTYTGRLETRIKNQREHLNRLMELGHDMPNKTERKQIARLREVIGRAVYRMENAVDARDTVIQKNLRLEATVKSRDRSISILESLLEEARAKIPAPPTLVPPPTLSDLQGDG